MEAKHYENERILALVDIPSALIEIIKQEVAGITTIKAIVVGAYMNITDGRIGTYAPEVQRIYLDLGNILNENTLYSAGMMFIPNVWYTMLWALGHEIEHALQLEAEPRLLEYDKLPQEYEDGAMKYGEDLVLKWSKTNKVPPLEKLGWLGKQLIVMLNAMYTKHPEVADEIEYSAYDAAAPLDAVFANWEFTPNAQNILIEEIDAGRMGVKIGGDRFLTSHEFLGL